jgi:glycerol-3-phosphate dehydrogenase
MAQEWAQTADDIVWRRSKLGLRMSAEQVDALARWIRRERAEPAVPQDARQ